MLPPFRYFLVILSVVALGAGGNGAGQPSDLPCFAQLSVLVDESGSGDVHLMVAGDDRNLDRLDTRAVTRAFHATVRPTAARLQVSTETPPFTWTIHGFAFSGSRSRAIAGFLDLTPLVAELHAQNVRRLNVVADLSKSGYSDCTLAGTLLRPERYKRFRGSIPTDSELPMLTWGVGHSVAPGDPRWLWLLVVVPLAVALPAWRLRRLAQRTDTDVTTLGFRYWRWQGLLILGTWVLWLVAVAASGAALHVNSWLPDSGTLARGARWGLLYVVPPLACTLLARAIADPARRRLLDLGWPLTDLTRRATGLQSATYAAALLACLGVAALFADWSVRLGVVLLLSAVAVRIAAALLLRRAMQMTPVPLLHGELRERVAALADRFGVREPQVGLLPSDRSGMVNAFALLGSAPGVWITDRLLREMSRREVDAVIAHELAHLRQHKLQRYGLRATLAQTGFTFLLVLAIFTGLALVGLYGWPAPGRWEPLSLAALAVLSHGAGAAVSRGKEFDADRRSVTVTGDAPSLITALTRLGRLNGLPDTWGRWEGLFLTHPSTSRRVAALARQGGLSPEQLTELSPSAPTEAERYPIPPDAVEGSLVFSAAFRRRVSGRLSWAGLAVLTLLPALVAWLAQLVGPGPLGSTILAIGAALPFLAYLGMANVLATSGGAALRRGVAVKLKAEGFDPEAAGATFVDFAPAAESLLYDGFGSWDVGFLSLGGNRLTYVGERTGFALTRGQVTDIRIEPGLPGWLRGRRAVVAWNDSATGAGGEFAVWPGDPPSLWQLRRSAAALAHRLRTWKDGDQDGESSSAPAGLGPPALATIHAIAPRDIVRARGMIKSILVLGLLELGLCALLGVSFAPTLMHGAGYAVAVLVGTCIAQTLPFWLSGRPRAKPVHGGAAVDVPPEPPAHGGGPETADGTMRTDHDSAENGS